MKSLLYSHSKHPSYKSILFKNKKQSSFPQSSYSLCCSCSFTKSTQGLRWRNAAFPTVTLTPGTSPEGHRVGNPKSKETNMLRSYVVVDARLQQSTVRALRIFLNPGNQDQGGETACSPLFLGKQISGTCLSQLSRSLKNKKRESD